MLSFVAEIQSMTDAVCHLKGLQPVLHMMEEGWAELEALDNVLCARAGNCVKLTNQRVQSQFPLLLLLR